MKPVTENGALAAPAKAPVDREAMRRAKNKLTEDGRPATLRRTGRRAPRLLTNNERIKLEKPGPDVWNDVVERYAKSGFDVDRRRRFGALQMDRRLSAAAQRRPFHDAPQNCRRLGRPTSNCARSPDVARDYARGIADITTRQTFQMHWLTIEKMPDIDGSLWTKLVWALSTDCSARAAIFAATSFLRR